MNDYDGGFGGSKRRHMTDRGNDMSGVLEITRKFTLLGKLRHYLFECPTFWRR